MLQTGYKLSSVQVNLPKHLAKEIIEWGHEHVPDKDVYEHPGCGREDEIHVTVFYGIKGDCASTVRSVCNDFKPFTVELGQVSLFATKPEFDVLKIEAISHDLHQMHQAIQKKVSYVETFPEYKPHITIAYLKKGRGWKHEGVDVFEERLFNARTVLFSNRSGIKSVIPLG